MSLLLPFVYQVDPYIVNSVDMCSANEINPRPVYIFRKSIKKLYSFFEKVYLFLVFTEEIAFKDFLFINIASSRFLLFFRDHPDIKK